MRIGLRLRVGIAMLVATGVVTVRPAFAQKPRGATMTEVAALGELTVARIYSQPSLSGQLARGLRWSPDGKLLTYFERKGSGKDARLELWSLDSTSGERKLLVSSEKLLSIVSAGPAKAVQA